MCIYRNKKVSLSIFSRIDDTLGDTVAIMKTASFYEILALSRSSSPSHRTGKATLLRHIWRENDEMCNGSVYNIIICTAPSILFKIRSSRCRQSEKTRERGEKMRKRKRKRNRQTFIHLFFFLLNFNARHIGTRDPLRAAYLSNTYDTHTCPCTRSRKYARIKVYEERKLRKLHTKGTLANPRGRPRTYQSVPNVGYPLEYDQQLEVLF